MSFDSRSRCAQHRWMRFVNRAYGFQPSHTIIPLNLRVKTSIRTFMPRLFRITKKVSDGVVNVQTQYFSPWTWIPVSSAYWIGASRILLKIASYSDRTASAARRVKSNIVAGLIFNPYNLTIASRIFLWGSLSSYLSNVARAITLFPNLPSWGQPGSFATTSFWQQGHL